MRVYSGTFNFNTSATGTFVNTGTSMRVSEGKLINEGVIGSIANVGGGLLTTTSTAGSFDQVNVTSGTFEIVRSSGLFNTLTGTTYAAGNNALNLRGGTLRYVGVNTDYSASMGQLGGVASTVDTNTQSVTFATGLSGTGGLTKSGTGTLSLTGGNTYTGATTVQTGTVSVGDGGGTGSIAGNADVSATGALVFNRTGELTYGGTISGAGGVAKLGAGTLTLTATNTFGGGLTINPSGGTVVANLYAGTGTNALGTGTATVGAGSTLLLANKSTTNAGVTFGNSLVGSGTVQVDFAAGTTSRNTFLTGLTGFTGTLVLSATGGLTGDKLNSAGYGTVAAALVVQPGTTFQASTSGTSTFTGGISVSGTGNREGVGAIRLGSNARLGGPVTLAGDTTIGSSGASGVELTGAVTTTATSTLTFGAPGAALNATFSGSLGDGTGRLALTKAQSGTLTLTGSSSFSGGVTIDAGSLVVGHASALGTGTATLGASGTLDLGSFAVANSLTNAGGTLANAANYAGVQTLTGSSTFGALGGTLAVASGGAATLNGALSGSMSIASGGSAKLGYTGSLSQANLVNDGTLTIDRTGSSSFGPAISGGGGLVKLGTGTVSLTSVSTFTGTTSVNVGDLRINGAVAGDVSVASGAILGGSGRFAGLSGAGLIAPGNSPGILTGTGSVDPSGGLDFAFELSGTAPLWSNATASVNDVLRIIDPTTPFTTALATGLNTVSVYLDVSTLTGGDELLGGFFTDRTTGLFGDVSAGNWVYYVSGTGGGTVSYNGVNYYTLADWMASPQNTGGVTGISVGVTTVPLADFTGGSVTNGEVTKFVVVAVPEPATAAGGLCGLAIAAWAVRRRGLANRPSRRRRAAAS